MNPNTPTFWQNTYNLYAPTLLGLCQRYIIDKNKAQDLMHDSFVTAITKQTTFMNKGSFEGWLRRITVNTVLMYLRKEKYFFQNIDDIEISEVSEEDEMTFQNTKSLILNSDLDKEDLIFAIEQLSIQHKTVFNLYVFDNLSHKEIAETFHISIGTSKSYLARARKKIQEILVLKVLEMKKKEQKVAILPFFVQDNFYLDQLYKKELVEQDVLDTKPSAALEHLLQNTQTVTIMVNFGLFYKIIGVLSIMFSMAVCYSFWNSKDITKINEPKQDDLILKRPNHDSIQDFSLNTRSIDSLKAEVKNISITKGKVPNAQAKTKNTASIADEDTSKQIIVVKKQVFEKDTLFK